LASPARLMSPVVSTQISPDAGVMAPISASASSAWPLPLTPAMP